MKSARKGPPSDRVHGSRALRKAVSRFVSVVAGLLAACVLMEAGLRLRIPASNVDLFTYTAPPELYRVMRPNVRGVVYGVPIETNNWGFRAKEDWAAQKPLGERRIIVLGDSFTVSAGVPFERIYTAQLEQRLQALRPAGPHVRVMNLAVGGYNLQRYSSMLTEVGLALDPDGIVVGIFPYNDFKKESIDRDRRIASGALPVPRDRREGSYLYLLCRATGWSLKSALSARFSAETEPQAWTEQSKALEAIAQTARQKGIPATAVLLPNTAPDFAGQRAAHEKVLALCERIGMRCVDSLDDFAVSGIPAHRFKLNIIDGHPNTAYHNRVSSRLSRELAGWVEDH